MATAITALATLITAFAALLSAVSDKREQPLRVVVLSMGAAELIRLMPEAPASKPAPDASDPPSPRREFSMLTMGLAGAVGLCATALAGSMATQASRRRFCRKHAHGIVSELHCRYFVGQNGEPDPGYRVSMWAISEDDRYWVCVARSVGKPSTCKYPVVDQDPTAHQTAGVVAFTAWNEGGLEVAGLTEAQVNAPAELDRYLADMHMSREA